MIIVDSDVWIDYWRRPSSATADALESLLREGEVLLVGLVLAELERGLHGERERNRAGDMLQALPYIEMRRETWQRAADIARDLDAQGVGIPITDACIAAIAIEGDHEILTRDNHFERIPGVRLYRPQGDNDA